MNGQPLPGQAVPGQPPFSGGMYPQYPYAMMPPPPPSPYGYYYPTCHRLLCQCPCIPEYVPYGADSTLANAYGMNFGDMYGQQSVPELSRCDCCKGIGVGLVEKNGVCAHCNRLRLAFIVDSAQMRQRCSVCGGWGFQLLQANGMCEHCTRQMPKDHKRSSSPKLQRDVAVLQPLPLQSLLGEIQQRSLPRTMDWMMLTGIILRPMILTGTIN
ncbi:Heat shock protein DnaJ, cysteine-rich domain [Phytophthora cactorum]|nr:Heat shock protein DnaJ, cysteine-rich domain [Phytophthora cactorum]